MHMASAAFLLPDDADVRAILFALADVNTDCAIYTQIERFTSSTVLWIVAEGGREVQETIAAVMELLPRFGLTYTEV
jgi:hypothetical protein